MRVVGRSVPRREGLAKARGAARYVDDLSFPGMLHGRTIRSTVARGELAAVHLDFDPAGFTIVDARDIPGRNVVALIQDDQPFLVEREVRHAEEAVLLLAHEDRATLRAASVRLEERPAEPLLDPGRSPRAFKEIAIEKGDLGRGFAEADVVVEGEYRTGRQEHVYVEPQGVIAVPEGGGMTVYGSLQCPYYVHKALVGLLGLPPDKVRIVQTETGGGFGGKEDYPSVVAGHAALLALKSGRPVKLVYDRLEDMAATTKRHPSVVRHRTGVRRDGTLTAMDIEVLLDGGAYCTLSPVVLSRGCLHASGPYRCANVRVRGWVVMTNTPPSGAFRGFGAPQTVFAAEVQMDRVAEALGVDPVRLREGNALRPGDTMATGQILGEDASALAVLREAVRRSDFHRKRRAFRGTNRGIGLSLFFHGAGFTGSGEVMLASKAALELTERGARVLVGSTEMGQGTRTTLAQVVSEALGIAVDRVEIADPDTARVPDSGPTVASRTCMVVGGLLKACAEEMKARMGGLSPDRYLKRHGPLVVTKQYQPPPGVVWDDATYRGDAYATYGWGCDVAEVELDPVTYEVRPTRVTAVVEIGRAVNPLMVAGQVEGGTAQGLGYALLEEVVMREGRMANAQLTNYLIPTTLDTPPIDVTILESPYRHGPFGAKGVGEMPMSGPGPAVANAVRHLGLDVRSLPITPEKVLECASS
ncbi:MAG TPA: xanthine dehydrogenase family protein molybdopterin-binding subunit, partial [Vicinamibacteria bacterium]|nr:xanthine dehydrogenase family protein molybdopterin-binding subunit [Vicinamibacteria bacterium]